MVSNKGGPPRFAKSASHTKQNTKSKIQNPLAPSDENWDGRFTSSNGLNDYVSAIAVSGADVYIGGNFTTAGAVSANHIAKWNSTTNTWSALGSGADNTINAITVSGSDLYVGGSFIVAGGVGVNHIAKWSIATNTWSALG